MDTMTISISRKSIYSALVLLLTFGASACSSLVTDPKLPVELPGRFSQSGDAELTAKWWLAFNDPELNNLIEQAIAENFSLRSAWSRLDQAESVARLAGVAQKPTVNITSGGGRDWNRREVFESGTSGAEPKSDFKTSGDNSFQIGLSSSYELDLWGRIKSQKNAAELDAKASREDLKAASITLSSQVAQAWLQLREQHGQIALLEEQIENNKKILELVTLRFRKGQAESTAVLRQRQLVENRNGDLTQARAQAQVLEHTLAILLGKTPGNSVAENSAVLPALPALPATGLPAELVARRPDIRRSFLRIQSADQRVAAAIADQYPRVTLGGQFQTATESWRYLFDTWAASIAADIVQPIMDGGRRREEIVRTRAVGEERLADFAQYVLLALGEVEDALVREQRQQEYLKSLADQLTLTDQIVNQTRENYAKGTTNYLNVLDAQLTRQALQRTQLQAKRRLIEYRINLYRALAGGWELDKPESLHHPALPQIPQTQID